MKNYLLSGFGPVHLDFYDLKGSIIDQETFATCENFYKLESGEIALPQNLYIDDIPLLRKSSYLTENLTTATLNQILNEANIAITNISLDAVWKDKTCFFEGEAIVCLSTTFIWSIKMFQKVLTWIKNSFEKYTLIVGGQFATLKTNDLLEQFKEIKYIICGDGENSLPEIINCLNHKKESRIPSIPNLIYRDRNSIVATKREEVNINTATITKFSGKKFAIPYVSMRGCPYGCKFCAQATTSSFRHLSAKRVVDDWKYYIKNNDASYFVVADSTFFIPFSRVDDLLYGISKLGVKWEANMRTDTPVTPEFVKLLETAGCFALSLGFESMNQNTLNAINKGTTTTQNRAINKLFKDSKIDTLMSFIVGFPGESKETFKDTSDYILNEHYGHYSIYVFELEDSTVPIWGERKLYNLELLADNDNGYQHMGKRWLHCGMKSEDAEKLRADTIKQSRLNKECKAIFYSWQRNFDCSFIPWESRQTNLQIEKLIDRLIFSCKDYPEDRITEEVDSIVTELKRFGVCIKS